MNFDCLHKIVYRYCSFFVFTVFILFETQVSYSQCFKQNTAFSIGEKIKYNIAYNWGIIWVEAGDAEFTVDKAIYQNVPVYSLKATGSSLKSYDWFYKVRDRIDTYLDMNTLKPLMSEKNTHEGGDIGYEHYVFDYHKNKIYSVTQSTDEPYAKDTLVNKGCIYDLLTASYYARSLDFSEIKVNQVYKINALVDDTVFVLKIKYLGKEQVTTHDKKKYNCLKFSSSVIDGTIFKSGEELYAWVTDDANHIPVMMEARILVGSIKVYLSSAENVRNPFTSRVY